MQKASSAGEHGGAGADPDAAAVGFGARATADARSLSERTKEAAGGGGHSVCGEGRPLPHEWRKAAVGQRKAPKEMWT